MQVEDFILKYEGQQRALLNYFHYLLTKEVGLIDKIRYKIPFYDHKSWICYLNPKKDGGVELAFVKGNQLSNEQGLLQAYDRKQIRGITFYKVAEIPEREILEIIQEALILDESVKKSSRKH